MKSVLAIFFAAAFAVKPLPQEEGPLEPSIQNEVDHALAVAGKWLADHATTNVVSADLFATNGLTREKIAIRLISLQRGEGYWLTPTNPAATKLAVEILKGL
ncbi:MAG: hypothetical protein ACI4Q3_08120 [Kiritimatiellia bacterium]